MTTFLRLTCQNPQGEVMINVDDISNVAPSANGDGSFIKFRGVSDGLYVNENVQQVRNNLLASEPQNIRIL